ncbi:MAG: DUF2975 domain-containing protein [Clostridia bacterium]|nr:DUF2975 domain-containing protein [Clostridia bacterium]
MEMTGVQKLARVLKVLVTVTFICNLAALLFVPCLVQNRFYLDLGMVQSMFSYDVDDGLAIFFDGPFYHVWQEQYTAVLTVFLWACGACTAVILWQGRRVLNSILKADTFTLSNAGNLRRAAVCCFLIATAALVRMVWGLFYYGSPAPMFTYNALFIPAFLMGGLLCLVMSALFRQAAELKAENDLTI